MDTATADEADRVRGDGVAGTAGPVRAAGANLPALRSHNTALVLGLLRAAGPDGISRLELAERTGLTPQAVSKITARLRAGGLAAEAGRRASTGGKPRTVLRLVPGAGHAVGVHLDRDELRAVLVDLAGEVRAEQLMPLDLGAGAEAVLGAVGRAVERLAGEAGPASRGAGAGEPGAGVAGSGAVGAGSGPGAAGPGPERERPRSGTAALLGVGVALPGPLDHTRGVLRRVTGFPGWDGFPLRDALAERLRVPVVVDKDTNAAALGLAADGLALGLAADGPLGLAADGPARAAPGAGAGSGRGTRPATAPGAAPPGAPSTAPGASFVYLHLGTGLGAGLVLGGVVHRGARTGAGEFGHQVVALDGPACPCGNRGCVEALCLAAVARGDTAEAARVLGVGAANVAGLLDIDLVLLGGRTVAAAPDAFVHGVGAVLDAHARRAGGPCPSVPVRIAPGGPRGVAEGAAHLLLAPLFGQEDRLTT